RFLSKHSGIRSGMLLGIIWAVWHVPDYLREPFGTYLALFATFVIIVTAQSVIMTWIFQRTGGILLPAALLHWMSNVVAGVFYNGRYELQAISAFLQLRIAVAVVLLVVLGIVLVYQSRTQTIRPDFELPTT